MNGNLTTTSQHPAATYPLVGAATPPKKSN